jgi:hypothetical protein
MFLSRPSIHITPLLSKTKMTLLHLSFHFGNDTIGKKSRGFHAICGMYYHNVRMAQTLKFLTLLVWPNLRWKHNDLHF